MILWDGDDWINAVIEYSNLKQFVSINTILFLFDNFVTYRGFQKILELKPIREPRAGWDEPFKKMAKNSDSELLMDDIFEEDIWE